MVQTLLTDRLEVLNNDVNSSQTPQSNCCALFSSAYAQRISQSEHRCAQQMYRELYRQVTWSLALAQCCVGAHAYYERNTA